MFYYYLLFLGCFLFSHQNLNGCVFYICEIQNKKITLGLSED